MLLLLRRIAKKSIPFASLLPPKTSSGADEEEYFIPRMTTSALFLSGCMVVAMLQLDCWIFGGFLVFFIFNRVRSPTISPVAGNSCEISMFLREGKSGGGNLCAHRGLYGMN